MRYFGTDGIRGRAYTTLSESLAIKVGKSLSLIDNDKVIIGYDTRESNHMLADAIALGARSVNKNVIDLGVIPTPGLAYCSLKDNCIGIMITASHNPYFDNGIKIFLNGLKLTEKQESLIEDFLDNEDDYIDSKNLGSYIYDEEYKTKYIDFLKSLIKKSPLRVGLDLANGATFEIAKKVFDNNTSKLVITANLPDGKNINNNVGSTHIKNISTLVKENSLDIGFSFDGDGDRMLVVDEQGMLHTGDEIIYVLANYLKENDKLTNNTVVLTIMSNLGIISSFKEKGINVITTSVGDKYVLQEMIKNNYILGGENSGHLIQLKYLPTGDGVLAALMLLNVLTLTNKSLSELTRNLKIYPDKLVNLKVKNKSVIKDIRVSEKVNEILDKYNNEIQLVVRASGTEDLVRVSCCHENYDIMNNVIDTLVELIRSIDV